MDSFYKELNQKLLTCAYNEYYDNFDFEIRKMPQRIKCKTMLEKYLNIIIQVFAPSVIINIQQRNYFGENINSFEFLYDRLVDKRSKEKYIEILAYKILGFTKVKLSLNNNKFWQTRKDIVQYKKNQSIPVNFRTNKLYLFELNDLGFNLKLYFVANGILVDFILQQYNYEDIVKVEKNDIVIDCGGCWGDTALYFASMGARDVYVYEFIPSNIEIMKQNLEINPHLVSQIHLVNNPVWENSGIKLSYLDDGPSSLVDDFNKFEDKTVTLSIDDLVEKENIDKVDFIKMDIEGAEIPALKGAVNTIVKFKPKLAISAYHKIDDLEKIPRLINSIRDDYKFYFDYYTIISDEAIVYAI